MKKTVCLSPRRVKAGASLARAVTRSDGKLLLPAGTEVAAEQLAHFNERGVEFVYIEVDDEREAPAIAQDVAAAEARVAALFRGESSEAREELRAVVLAYRRQQAS